MYELCTLSNENSKCCINFWKMHFYTKWGGFSWSLLSLYCTSLLIYFIYLFLIMIILSLFYYNIIPGHIKVIFINRGQLNPTYYFSYIDWLKVIKFNISTCYYYPIIVCQIVITYFVQLKSYLMYYQVFGNFYRFD